MAKLEQVVDRTCLQFVAGHEAGRSLEICIADPDGSASGEPPYPLATIVESDDNRKWLVFESPRGTVRLSLEELERAISAARDGVFSERRWLEEMCPKDAE
jgi:hypothetical protein